MQQWRGKWQQQKSAPCPPLPLSPLRTRLLLQLTVKIKWDFGAVQLHLKSKDDCEASGAVINGHDDYDGPDIGCRYVCAILPVGGEIATNWGIRWECNVVLVSFLLILNVLFPPSLPSFAYLDLATLVLPQNVSKDCPAIGWGGWARDHCSYISLLFSF